MHKKMRGNTYRWHDNSVVDRQSTGERYCRLHLLLNGKRVLDDRDPCKCSDLVLGLREFLRVMGGNLVPWMVVYRGFSAEAYLAVARWILSGVL